MVFTKTLVLCWAYVIGRIYGDRIGKEDFFEYLWIPSDEWFLEVLGALVLLVSKCE
jgi:hypothetical protein